MTRSRRFHSTFPARATFEGNMTTKERIENYRHRAADCRVLAEEHQILAQQHTESAANFTLTASGYDRRAAQLESTLAQEQPNQEAGGGETAEFIHQP